MEKIKNRENNEIPTNDNEEMEKTRKVTNKWKNVKMKKMRKTIKNQKNMKKCEILRKI